MNRVIRRCSIAAAVSALSAAPLQSAYSQTYAITELGTLGGTSSTGAAVNNAGQVVGSSSLAGDLETHAFLFSRGKMLDLGTLGGRGSNAYDINNRGQVTGESSISSFPGGHGFIYSKGVLHDIGILDDDCVSPAAINDSGDITGASGCRRSAAFVYQSGQIYLIGGFGGPDSGGWGINNRGQIVGNASVIADGFPPHAFLYTAGSMLDLGTLGGSSSFVESTHSINRHGDVTGSSDIQDDLESHAFLYSNGSMQDLGTLGGSFAAGIAINDRGQVVGFSNTRNNTTSHAFFYSNGRMVDIGTLGGTVSYSQAINNHGDVIGYSLTRGNKELHAFLYRGHRLLDLNSLVDGRSPLKKRVTLMQSVAINEAGDIVAQGVNNVTGINSAYLLEECRNHYSHSDHGDDDAADEHDGNFDQRHRSRDSCRH